MDSNYDVLFADNQLMFSLVNQLVHLLLGAPVPKRGMSYIIFHEICSSKLNPKVLFEDMLPKKMFIY